MPTITVTGANGHLGRLVVQQLLQKGVKPADCALASGMCSGLRICTLRALTYATGILTTLHLSVMLLAGAILC